MPKSHKGHKYILCIIDEVTNSLVTMPIFQAKLEEVGEAILEHVITKHCIPDYIIMDQDSAFMSSLVSYLFHRLNIKIKMVGPYNHQSLQAEHGIKSLTRILAKHLTGLGQMWMKYLSLATFAYNTFNSPNLGNYSPFESTFGRKPKVLLNTETNPNIKIYKGGDLVYIISPLTSQLRTNSQKVAIKYVGPVVIYKIIDPHNYLLITLDGVMLRGIFEHERLKPTIIRTNQGNVDNLAELKQIMNTEIRLEQ